MKLIIDRFEGAFAVCESENGKMYNIPAEILKGFCEGDILKIERDGNDANERKERIKKLEESLFESE